MLILHQHLNNCEESLLSQARIPGASGHNLHKGTPREVFIREFLGEHLPLDYSIGTGEIIDHQTEAAGERNQIDIVIFKNSFPRIHFGGQINAFMRESVIATIEVKSVLDYKELKKSIQSARNVKGLKDTAQVALRPVANYVVAYSGAAKMDTVFNWITSIYQELSLEDPSFSPSFVAPERRRIASASIDGVFLLGVGACMFENNVGVLNPYFAQCFPEACWSIINSKRGSLALLFAALLGFMHDENQMYVNSYSYLESFEPRHVQLGAIRPPHLLWVSPLIPRPAQAIG
jgi:hypothetical protein